MVLRCAALRAVDHVEHRLLDHVRRSGSDAEREGAERLDMHVHARVAHRGQRARGMVRIESRRQRQQARRGVPRRPRAKGRCGDAGAGSGHGDGRIGDRGRPGRGGMQTLASGGGGSEMATADLLTKACDGYPLELCRGTRDSASTRRNADRPGGPDAHPSWSAGTGRATDLRWRGPVDVGEIVRAHGGTVDASSPASAITFDRAAAPQPRLWWTDEAVPPTRAA